MRNQEIGTKSIIHQRKILQVIQRYSYYMMLQTLTVISLLPVVQVLYQYSLMVVVIQFVQEQVLLLQFLTLVGTITLILLVLHQEHMLFPLWVYHLLRLDKQDSLLSNLLLLLLVTHTTVLLLMVMQLDSIFRMVIQKYVLKTVVVVIVMLYLLLQSIRIKEMQFVVQDISGPRQPLQQQQV